MPDETQPSNEDKIAESIVRGLKPVLEQVSTAMAQKPAAPAAPVQSAPILSRPSEDELAAAMVEGNQSKVADILRKQRAYDKNEFSRELGNLSTVGSSAISSVARTAAAALPYYKRFRKEIDEMVDNFKSANPGAIATVEVYERAHDIIKGQHADELIAEATEEAIRRAREPEPVLEPTNDRGERIKPEPKSLAEVLTGDWNGDLRKKNGRNGANTDDTELRKLGWKGGLPEFLKDRKAMEAMSADGDESFGLDRDWVWTDKAKGEGHYIN